MRQPLRRAYYRWRYHWRHRVPWRFVAWMLFLALITVLAVAGCAIAELLRYIAAS